jgi:diadenosine tetraphosphate (Ap4A) HIT family hydrolase
VLVLGAHALEAAEWLAHEGVQVALHPAADTAAGTDMSTDTPRLWVRPAIDGRLLFPRKCFAGCWIGGNGQQGDVDDVDLVRQAMALLAPGAPIAVRGEIVAKGAGTEPAPDAEPEPADCPLCPAMRFQMNAVADLPGAAGTLYHDEHVFVMPDVAPVIEGHLLVVTTRHGRCSAAVDTATWQAMEEVKVRIREVFRRVYGTGAVFFEHGPARPRAAGSCIDHTHWHCLPASRSIRPAIDAHGLAGQKADRSVLQAWYRRGQSYLAVQEGASALYAFPADDEGLPRQFLRWAAWTTLGDGSGSGSRTGGGDWRWHVALGSAGSRAVFLETVNRLLPASAALLPAQPKPPKPPDSHQ